MISKIRMSAKALLLGVALAGVSSVSAAAEGWYLLIPPRDANDKVLTSKPLSQWFQDSAYDSARECEEAQSAHRQATRDLEARESKRGRGDFGAVFAAELSRCIKSDDPRLAK